MLRKVVKSKRQLVSTHEFRDGTNTAQTKVKKLPKGRNRQNIIDFGCYKSTEGNSPQNRTNTSLNFNSFDNIKMGEKRSSLQEGVFFN